MNSRDLSGGSSKMYRTFSNHYKKGSTYEMFLNLGGGKSNYGMAQKYSGMTMGNRPSSRSGSTRRKTSTARSKSRYNHAPKKNEPMDDIKGNLKKIFEFYVSFGERMNLKYMKSNKFLKLMQDTAIPLDKTTLDLLFVVENKHRYFYLWDNFSEDLTWTLRYSSIYYPNSQYWYTEIQKSKKHPKRL